MRSYCDYPYQLSFPYRDAAAVDIAWGEIEHLLPSIQCCGFDSRAGFLALFLHGGFVQLCDVLNGTIIPQSYFLLPDSQKKTCNTIVWSRDAKRLILSLSWKPRVHGAAEHEIVVWDILSSSVSHRVRSCHAVQYLQPLDNSDLLLCHSTAPPNTAIQILHLPTYATACLSSGGENGQEFRWVESGTLETPASSSSPLCVQAAVCRFIQPTSLEIFIVAEDPTTQSLALHILHYRGDGKASAAIETRRMGSRILSPTPRSPIHLSMYNDLLLLSAPLSSLFQLYAVREDDLVLEGTLSAGIVGKDCAWLGSCLTSFPFATRPTAVVVLQQSSRLHPASRVLLWPRGESRAIVLKQSGLALQKVYASSAGLVLGVDGTGKVRVLPVEPKNTFAGAMYPVGYELINSVRTYDEKEDELDKPVSLCTTSSAAAATQGPVVWSPRPGPVIEDSALVSGRADDYLSALPYLPTPLSRTELRMNTSGTASSRSGHKSTASAPVSVETPSADVCKPEDNQNPEREGEEEEEEEVGGGTTEGSVARKSSNCFAITAIEALLPPPRRISSGDYQNNLLRKREHYKTIQALGRDADARFQEFIPSCISAVANETMKAEKRRLAAEERKYERKKARDSALLQVMAAMQQQQQQQQQQLLLQQQQQQQLALEQQQELLLQAREQELLRQEEVLSSTAVDGQHERAEEPLERQAEAMEPGEASLEIVESQKEAMEVVASVVDELVNAVAAPVAEQEEASESHQPMDVAAVEYGV